MADVLIRGIDMSKGGDWKMICIYPDGTCEASNWQSDCTFLPCTVIPLPAGHGNMIDVDALEDMDFESCDTDDCYEIKWRISGRNNIRQIIKNAPIIIPAEGDNN